MDIRPYDKFVVNWSVSGEDITLTFRDETEVTMIGEITIQTTRLRSFLDSLVEVAPVYAPPVRDNMDREYCRTLFKEDKSLTEFQ